MTATGLTYRLVRFSGLPWLFREVLFRNRVRTLMFHDPTPEAMDRVLGYLGRRYRFITLADLERGTGLPPKAMLLTFDDGHRGNAALLPLFLRHSVRPVIFLCAGIVGTQRHYWFRHRPLPTTADGLKDLPNAERLRQLATVGFAPEKEFPERQALSLEELETLRPHVDFASHGLLHPCLNRCSDADAEAEVTGSKHVLQERFGVHTTVFAYPNGDYTAREIALLERAGYTRAFTVDHGFNGPGERPFRLKRLSIDDDGDLASVSVKASGVWGFLRILSGRQPRTRLSSPPNHP